MTEWVKVPDYQSLIATECMVCGKEINLGYGTNHLFPMICKECKDAIKYAKKLLEKQEAVEPIPYHRSDGTVFKYECRKCRTKIFKMDLFCRHCGRSVKWE